MNTYPDKINFLSKALFTALLGLLFLWRLALGKDINWDQINYHLYIADLLINNRWKQDYFAASIQSYLNPLAYLPFYKMVTAGWSDILITSALTCFHLISVWLMWKITAELLPDTSHKPIISLAGAALGAATPIFLSTIGTSFIDPITAILILASVLLLARTDGTSRRATLWMGALMGFACGLKLTNGVAAVTLGTCICLSTFSRWGWKRCLSQSITYLASAFGAFMFSYSYWGLELWEQFRNPFFPYFNSIFKSHDFIEYNIRDERFLGTGLKGALLLPWDMLKSNAWIYSEAAAPDMRVLPLIFLILAGSAGRYISVKYSCTGLRGPRHAAGNALSTVSSFFLISFILWANASRIGRYALPTLMLAGPLLVAWLYKLCSQTTASVATIGALVMQCALFYMNGIQGWAYTPFTDNWLDLQLPAPVRQQPATFLTASLQPYGALSLALHSKSTLINISGQYEQPAGLKSAEKLKTLLLQPQDVYLVFPSESGTNAEQRALTLNDQMMVRGFKHIPAQPCLTGKLAFHNLSTDNRKGDGTYLHFCKLIAATAAERQAALEYLEKYDSIFTAIERDCGRHFLPPGGQSIATPLGVRRFYFDTSASLFFRNNNVYSYFARTLAPTLVGSLDEVSGTLKSARCPSSTLRYLE